MSGVSVAPPQADNKVSIKSRLVIFAKRCFMIFCPLVLWSYDWDFIIKRFFIKVLVGSIGYSNWFKS